MSKLDAFLSDVEKRLKAATPGPWTTKRTEPLKDANGWSHWMAVAGTDRSCGVYAKSGSRYPSADASFIAHSPQDVAGLVAVVRAVQKWIKETREAGIAVQQVANLDGDHYNLGVGDGYETDAKELTANHGVCCTWLSRGGFSKCRCVKNVGLTRIIERSISAGQFRTVTANCSKSGRTTPTISSETVLYLALNPKTMMRRAPY